MQAMFWKMPSHRSMIKVRSIIFPYLKLHSHKDYELAMKRVRTILETDYEAENAKKSGTGSSTGNNDVIYAVFEAFSK